MTALVFGEVDPRDYIRPPSLCICGHDEDSHPDEGPCATCDDEDVCPWLFDVEEAP